MLTSSEKSRSSASVAVEKLRGLIFSGELGAGTDHLESELAQTLGMSRTPVREAVVTLESQGLLDVRPRKGVRIRPMSPADMAEIYDVLTELESLAAENAAKMNYSDADLAQLAASIDQMDAALKDDHREAWAEADQAFHTELVRLGGNSRVQAIVGMMSDQVRRARLVTLYMRPAPTKSNEDHRGVLNAIRKRNPSKARSIHRDHRTNAKVILLDLLNKHHLSSL